MAPNIILEVRVGVSAQVVKFPVRYALNNSLEELRTVVVTLCKIEPVSSQIWISYPFSLRQGVFRGTHFHTNERL